MKAILFRALLITHRYAGIAIGWLMLLWCLSGLVMMYVAYPELGERQRVMALDALEMQACCHLPAELFDATTAIGGLSVEMLADQPHLRIRPDIGPPALINMRTGQVLDHIDAARAQAVASHYQARTGLAGRPALLGLLDRDQWTVYPRYNEHRPLYRFAMKDAAGSELYVSSVTGEVVQATQRTQRFWNWLGAVPHWLYFTELRQRPVLWSQVVIWTSSIGTFLALFGLYLGVWQLRRRADNKVYSPYRGWKYWHHVPGLVFGVMVLTWVFSGLTSMTPWRWLESEGGAEEARVLRGRLPPWSMVRESLLKLPRAALPDDTLRLSSAMLDGVLHYIAETRAAARTRFDERWQTAPLSQQELDRMGELLGGLRMESLTQEDAYYYALNQPRMTLPVLRARSDDGDYYYLDASTGALLQKVDAGARRYRWLHTALHRLDFHAVLRTRPLRDVLMWTLLLGATSVCLTGLWLGVKYLRGK